MKNFQYKSSAADETTALGAQLAKFLKKGDIVCLFGNLGSGKTTLVKGIARGLKINPHKVQSPSFTLMNIYEGKQLVYHFDFYRLKSMEEIAHLGYEEFFFGEGITVIEWPQRLNKLIPADYVPVQLFHKGEDKRLIKILPKGLRAKEIIKELSS